MKQVLRAAGPSAALRKVERGMGNMETEKPSAIAARSQSVLQCSEVRPCQAKAC